MASGAPPLDPSDILATLRDLSLRIRTPLWLFGGVAVDFLAGRWTRPHSDIDLNALSSSRASLTLELNGIGYSTTDDSWLTQWFHQETGRRLEIVFLDQSSDGKLELVIPEGAPLGVPGHYPIIDDYLNPGRFGTLEGLRFRVGSPAGEWLARARGLDVVGGRAREPKLVHDLAVLEQILAPEELTRLRALCGSET